MICTKCKKPIKNNDKSKLYRKASFGFFEVVYYCCQCWKKLNTI
jgi:hypothetical protein